MSILNKWLEKLGVKSQDELSSEEQATYYTYKRILYGETVTIDTLKEFCKTQIKQIELKFAEEKGRNDDDVYYKACLFVYTNLIRAIEAPEAEREALERHLASLIQKL